MFLFNGNLQRGRTILNSEPPRVKNSTAADGQQSFGGRKRRLHENLRSVAWLIGFLIRNERNFFLLHCAGRRLLSTTDPTREAALIFATEFIGHDGRDLVASTKRCFKGT